VSLIQDFQLVEAAASVDSAGCVRLGSLGNRAIAGEYRILINAAGQILLDPIEPLPEQEQWFWQNSATITAVKLGVAQAKAGQVRNLGSFAEYADLEIDD
jgi:hypothetical protein